MNAIDVFEAATDAEIKMFVRDGHVIVAPAKGRISTRLQRCLESQREPIRQAVLMAQAAVERARRNPVSSD